MGQTGIGVMLSYLGGNEESVNAFKNSVGKKISTLYLGSDDALHFEFEDSSRIAIYDNGQSCCEHRYMRTDDDLNYYIGSNFLDAELRDAPDVEDGGDVHEVQFLLITTSNGVFTMASHNEHNGYYGGFSIRFRKE